MAAAYAALAVFTTWPLALHLGDHIVGHAPREATPALNIWSMAWVVHQLPRDPLHLFDANSFYPYGGTLAFSEHLFVPALMAAPVAATSGNWVLAYNLLSLGTLVLAACAMYALALHLSASRLAAFGAGALYAFHTWNVNELVRVQIPSNAWFPLLVLALLRYFDEPRASRAAWVGVFYLLQSLSCMYWALYAPLLVVLVVAVLQAFRRLPVAALGRLAAGLVPSLIVVGVFLVPYVRTSRALGFERDLPDPLPLERYLAVLPGNLLWGGVLDTGGPNQGAAHFPGFVALALAGVGLWRPHPSPAVRLLLGTLVVAGFALSLGPRLVIGEASLGPGPYLLLRDFVPGFGNVRYPERFALFVMLGLAPAVALGLVWLRPRVGKAGTAGLVLLLWLEHLAVPLYLDPLAGGAAIPEVYRRLAERDVQAVAEVPAHRHRLERFDALPMYYSTAHWKRTVEGFSGYFPPTYNFAKWRLWHFPAPESVAFAERFGIDAIVVRPEGLPRVFASLPPGWTIDGPFAGGHHLLLRPGTGAADVLDRAGPSPLRREEIPRLGWRVQASSPGAAHAVDGDVETSWGTPQKQTKGEFYRVAFPDPLVVSRISIAVRRPYEFPMRLRLIGFSPEGAAADIPFDETASYDRLFMLLRRRPREASLDLDFAPRALSGFRLRIAETDPFFMPWTMAELRAYRP
ncbi:MAG TPA: hypothetical protein VMR21_15405 [Vicinamibacteria bacterium]|nr:hypothetical protein [Vicinamibacteria bacterium]